MDNFYAKREQADRVKQKGQDLLKTANNAAARLRRKITMQEKELLDSKDRDKWRIYGELITANLYRMERGMSRLTAQNYYDPACKDIDIPLDVRLSPQENAAKYFKKYTKAKTAEKYLTEQLTRAGAELEYLESVLQELGIEKVDGIYLDLGVSSYQLDTADRGFTYNEDDAPLDMRMDQRNPMTAADIVNEYDEMDLYRIIHDYGEDKFAKNIAKHIVAAREKQPIETTGELTAIIRSAIPKKVQMSGGHPAKRTFQAIRIELNRELEVLQDTLDDMIELLNEDGKLVIDSIKPSNEDEFISVFELLVLKDGMSYSNIANDFSSCDLTFNNETHTVEIAYNYNKNIKVN